MVEILSPSNAYLDKKAKLRVYAREGVKELWIVDPEARLLHDYGLPKNADNPSATYETNDTFTSEQFPGLRISCAEIFRKDR